MLSKIANISYNLASKYDVQMSKRLQLLGALVPLPGLRPWTALGTSIPHTPCAPYLQIEATPLTFSIGQKLLRFVICLPMCH